MHNGDFSALLRRPTARSTPSTTRPRRVAVAGGRFSETPFPGNIIPANALRPGRRGDPSYYPTTEKTPGRCHRPGQLPGRHHRGKGQVLQPHRPRGPEPRRPAALLRPLQHLHPQQHVQQLLRQRRSSATSSTSTRRPRSSTTSSRCRPTMVLNTRYSYNRFIRGSDQPADAVGFDLTSLGFSPQFISQVPEGPGALPAHQPDRLYQQRLTPTRTGRSTITRSPPPSPNRRARIPSAPASNTASTRKPTSSKSNQQTGQFTFDSTWTRGPLDNSASVSGQHRPIGCGAAAGPARFRQHRPPAGLHRAVRILGLLRAGRLEGRPAS